MKKFFLLPAVFVLLLNLFSCQKEKEMTLEEIENYRADDDRELLDLTVSKPYENQKFIAGKKGGVWNASLDSDPKTFNIYIAERDATSNALVSYLLEELVDYDANKREWIPKAASFKIETDKEKDTLTVHYTLRDDMYWTWPCNDRKIPVSADDVVWYYNEVQGNVQFASSGYTGQFVTMADGSERHIECIKTGEKTFDFIFPRIVADPILATNTILIPHFVYKDAMEKNGVQGVKDLFAVNIDVKELPSCGMWYLTEYTPGQRLVYCRNENYWQKDERGISIPYREKMIFQIIGEENTSYLLFKEGKLDYHSPKPEQLSEMINDSKDIYTVYNAEGSYGAPLWSFNQNPQNKNENYYRWFTKKQFRQAMSCILNRDRIALQVYRGLASAKLDFFSEINPYYNPKIKLKYLYDLEHARKLLESIGIKMDSNGIMRDEKNIPIEFDLTVVSGVSIYSDIASIIADEASKIGIKINIRQTDFQKLVEMLTSTYDWQSLMVGLGSNAFPSQGSNVWPSKGNLHLWYPLQKEPATDWEERLDYVYNEGSYTIDRDKAQKLWDEENEIILEQCPVIYLMQSKSFFALNNRWNDVNFYYDNKYGARTEYIFLR